jgi:hypothetical protein
MTDDQSPDTGPKSSEGLEKVRSGDELFMQSFERLAAGPHPSQRPPTRIQKCIELRESPLTSIQ